MNVAQTFLLLMWAIIGLCLIMSSPSRRFRAQTGGCSNEEVSVLLLQKDEQGITLGCRQLPGMLLELIQSIIVEPVYLLWGLLTHVGQKEFAYGVLAALLVNVLLSIVADIIRKKRNQLYPQITWLTWTSTFIASLPTLYLWYLFFVVVGVVH